MKKLIVVVICATCFNKLVAQLKINSGAEITMTANSLLTIQDMDLVNDGIFTQAAGTVRFTGSTNSNISGSQPVQFYNLELAKGVSNQVSLLRNIQAANQVMFTAGYIDLNGFNILLSPAALLSGENENSRIRGTMGGFVEITNTLNAPASTNPGNLGATITTAANMGVTTIRRGHRSQTNGYGQGSTVLRYYDITPATNSGLNATLRFNYFDAELNALPENLVTLWKSTDLTHWHDQGSTSRNTTTNYVELTGIPGFSRWTLTTPGNPLPVKFILFNAKCSNEEVLLNWKTAFEQNSSHFEIQRSPDALSWSAIGTVPAAGFSSVEKSYFFLDHNPVSATAFYRIAEFDFSGNIQYTGIIRYNCSTGDDIQWWPNPVIDQLYIAITRGQRETVVINTYNSKGALVAKQQSALLGGYNQLTVDMSRMAAGFYFVSITGNNGAVRKTIKVFKQ
jgi:Secretion system C-terminal sorting domain